MDQTEIRTPTVGRFDYPLSTERPELLQTKTKKPFTSITLAKMREQGQEGLRNDDLRIHPQTLNLQAQIARDAGRPELADNLRRAAELAGFDDEMTILGFYNAMRPSRASRDGMQKVAKQLEENHAPLCAQLVRDAIEVYEERNLFKRRDDATQPAPTANGDMS